MSLLQLPVRSQKLQIWFAIPNFAETDTLGKEKYVYYVYIIYVTLPLPKTTAAIVQSRSLEPIGVYLCKNCQWKSKYIYGHFLTAFGCV